MLGLVLLTGLALRLPTFGRTLLSSDEAAYSVVAEAMHRGGVLYRDTVDHKPPAIYDMYLASFKLLGPYNTQLAHLLVVLAVLLTAFALSRAAGRMWRDGRAGWVAALLLVVFSTTMPDFDALAANGELFLLAAQGVAFAWLAGGLARGRGQRWGTLFGVGVLTGVAVAFKYQGATFLAVAGVALLLEVSSRRRTSVSALAGLAVVLAGCLVVPSFYVGRAWMNGGLADMWFWFRYNFTYIGAGPRGLEALRLGLMRTALVATGAFLPYAFGLTGTWRTVRACWRRGFAGASRPELAARILAVVWLTVSVVALLPGQRFFGHYFHLVLPASCLLATGPLLAFWDRFKRPRPVLALLVLVPAAVALVVSTVLHGAVMDRLDPKPPYEEVAARLRAESGPDDSVFLWGHSVEVYVLARRTTGTRFVFCDYLTGTSPGTRSQLGLDDPAPNVVQPAWGMLFDDLEHRRPRFLVDLAPAAWNGYDRFPLSRYPALDAYVRAHYLERDRVAGVRIYERNRP
jgi:4-amino-4-deoxy-L-arabinose transferase-like glycosyltransferase